MAILHAFVSKIKRVRDALNGREDIFIALLIVLVGLGSFGLGRLSVAEKGDIRIYNQKTLSASVVEGESRALQGMYVGSKNSTKYHAPWCSGASRIKEENKIWFSSKEEARASGYEPAGNCKGL